MNKKLFGALVLVAALAIAGVSAAFASPAFATGSGAIWTTDGSCGDVSQDVNHFQIGDHVYINGAGFDASTSYPWLIKGQPGNASGDPGVTVASGNYTTGADGTFCFDAYTVQSDDSGEYSVKFGNKGDNYRVEGAEPTETPTPTETPPTPTETPPTPTETPPPTETPVPEVYTISTGAVCGEEADSVDYLSTITASKAASGTLKVLWYYPNGTAFVSGETTIGTINLSVGENDLQSSLTEDLLKAAIGNNNLTGGNSANDSNYDKLDMYKYELRLYIDGQDVVVSNKAPLWIYDCGTHKKIEKPSCPKCGPPVWESAKDGLAVVWYSPLPCEVCTDGHGGWVLHLDSRVRLWSEIPFTIQYHGQLLTPSTVAGDDGKTYYVIDNVSAKGDWIIWGPDGVGDRFRAHGPVYKYSACSVAPGYYDAPGGVAQWKPGHTVADWVTFLLNEGFFPRTYAGVDQAYAWASQLRTEGSLALPSK